MKTIFLTTAAFLFTTVLFAQTNDNAKNAQGVNVSTTAKTTTNAEVKGTEVSTVASAKSKAELHRKNTAEVQAIKNEKLNSASEARTATKTSLKAERAALKAKTENVKAGAKAKHEDKLIEVKADAKAKKDNKVDIKTKKSTRVKGAKTGAHLGVGHTAVKTNAGAGLKLKL